MIEPPPATDLDTIGGMLRFGVGEPDGRRPSPWRVMGSKNEHDIYLGPRPAFNTFKLSLHKSGVWRFAYTEEGAKKQGIVGDRLIQRYPMPPEVAPGWRVCRRETRR